MNEVEKVLQVVKENIEYDILFERYPSDRDMLDGIVSLMMETLLNTNNIILIARNQYPAELVKNRFRKLKSPHIEYVLSCMCKNTTKIRNIRKYLLASLFNAPITINAFYMAEINHDMPQYAK